MLCSSPAACVRTPGRVREACARCVVRLAGSVPHTFRHERAAWVVFPISFRHWRLFLTRTPNACRHVFIQPPTALPALSAARPFIILPAAAPPTLVARRSSTFAYPYGQPSVGTGRARRVRAEDYRGGAAAVGAGGCRLGGATLCQPHAGQRAHASTSGYRGHHRRGRRSPRALTANQAQGGEPW